MKQSKKDIILEILRFLVVGGVATLADYAVFYGLNLGVFHNQNDGWQLPLATAAGFIVGLIVNWILQKFVYRYLDKSQTKSKLVFLKFVILSLIGLGITELGINLAEPLYGWNVTIIVTFDFWKLFFKCLMTGIVLIINYIGRKFLVFKSPNKINNDEEIKKIEN